MNGNSEALHKVAEVSDESHEAMMSSPTLLDLCPNIIGHHSSSYDKIDCQISRMPKRRTKLEDSYLYPTPFVYTH